MTKKLKLFADYRSLSLLLFSCMSFLLLFQGRWAVANHPGVDEICYLDYFHRFWGETYSGCYYKSYFWGVALTWWPLGIVSKLTAFLFGIPFTDTAVPLIGLLAFVMWSCSLFLIDETGKIIAKNNGQKAVWPGYWSLIILLATPVTLYVFRLNFYTHASELLLVCLTFYFLVKQNYTLAIIFSAWTFATRLNDIFLIFVVFAFLWEKLRMLSLSKKQKIIFCLIALTCLTPILIRFWNICFVTGYNGYFLTDVIRGLKWEGFVKSLVHPIHGILWHDLIWFGSVFYFATKVRTLSKAQLVILLWQIAAISIHASQFIFYGYSENRLFIGSYLALFFSLGMLWPKLSKLEQRSWGTLIFMTALWRTWYFVAATAPGLRYWTEVLKQKEQDPVVSVLQMLLNPIKTIEITAGLSPLGFSMFSWLKDLPYFSRYQDFSKYCLNGFSLQLLTTVSVLLLILTVFALFQLLHFKKNKVLQRD